MRSLLLLFLVPLALLACLHRPPAEKPNLAWLEGCWHDPEHPSTRMIWTSSPEGGGLGLLSNETWNLVLSIAPNGRLVVRNLGPQLTENSPPQEQPLLQQGPQELFYRQARLSYLNTRTTRGALLVEWNGACWRLRHDS